MGIGVPVGCTGEGLGVSGARTAVGLGVAVGGDVAVAAFERVASPPDAGESSSRVLCRVSLGCGEDSGSGVAVSLGTAEGEAVAPT